MSKVVTASLECPLCTLEGEATVVLDCLPGRSGVAVDDVRDINMSCTCLQSRFVKQDDLRLHLNEQAREYALERAA
jgi:hypothetical protein